MRGDKRGEVVDASPPSSWDTSSWAGLREVVAEDRRTNPGGALSVANQVLLVNRLQAWAASEQRSTAGRKVVSFVCRAASSMHRNVLGIEVSPGARLGRRVRLMHHVGVTIGPAQIGDDVTIYHNVTIGMRWHGDWPGAYHGQASVGRGVILATGATIIGSIAIGDDARVGPHSVVTTNVPGEASVVAPPSRVLRLRDTAAVDG